MIRAIILAALFLSGLASAQAAVSVQNLRLWRAPDHTRIVFDLSGPLEYRLEMLSGPPRIVIDLEQAVLKNALPALDDGGRFVAQIRAARFDADTLRIVLDLKAETHPRAFVLKPAGPYGHRLVVDLLEPKATADGADEEPGARPPPEPLKPRPITIAIDAGHGGEDPGAIGRRYRTREKDVTLSVARELARLVERTPGMRVVLIRDGDYYIGLRQRFLKARAQRADIFVSIHADAVPGREVRGSSVYALSERGATDATAKLIADKENAADLIGGVSLNDKDDVLARVLLDLSHTKTIHDSLRLGADTLSELKRVGPVHSAQVRQAGFTVLKAPDIPSVLVETAYISNPTEEKKLRTRAFQRQLAAGIFKGVQRFLARARETPAAPPTPRVHVVRRGETLAAIARKYAVPVDVLRFANNLGAGEPPRGQPLQIP